MSAENVPVEGQSEEELERQDAPEAATATETSGESDNPVGTGSPSAPSEGNASTAEQSPPGPPSDTQPSEQGQAQELKNDLLRVQAEYVNYRKRVERDRDVARKTATAEALTALLPVLDDIDAARSHGELDGGPFAAIAKKLEGVLASLGLERIDNSDVVFNPTVHEALAQQPSGEVSQEWVVRVYRTGFRLGGEGTEGQLLRPAQVEVAVPE